MPQNKDEQEPSPLAEWVSKNDKAKFEENQQLVRRASAARAVAADQLAELEKLRRSLGLYEKMYATLERRHVPPTWLAPAKPGRQRAIPSGLLTDIHWDETVEPEEIEGYNCYNRSIAERRVKRFFTKSVELAQNYFAGVDVRRLPIVSRRRSSLWHYPRRVDRDEPGAALRIDCLDPRST
jgi:hypothetical protein